MKKSILLLLAAIISLPLYARDFEYTYDGQTLKYTVLDEEAKTCETAMGSFRTGSSQKVKGKLTIPSIALDGETKYSVVKIDVCSFYYCKDITSVAIPNSVTSIAEYAFKGCIGLTSVTIPDSVTKIGNQAFYACDNLIEVFFNAEDCEFDGEASSSADTKLFPSTLQKVTFGENVKTIPSYALSDCTGLTSVTIPNSVSLIGSYAFYHCTGLTSVTIPNSVTSIERGAFSRCYGLTSMAIPNSVTSIESRAFKGCIGLTSVTIPNSVTSIGSEAFCDCTGLTSVTIPNSVTSIGEGAFIGCSGLTSVAIPNSVTSIEKDTFSYCTGLTSVTIPNFVTSIGEGAFKGCSNLTEVFFNAENCVECGESAFPSSLEKVTFGDNVKIILASIFYNCEGLRSVTIGNSVTSIGEGAFKGCSNLTEVFFNAENCVECGWNPFPASLTKVTFGENVKIIPSKVFINCRGLTSVTISNSVTSIGEQAFACCTALTSVTIPIYVTSIGKGAFSSCEHLTELFFNAENCVECGEAPFPGSLTKVTFGENIKGIPDYIFYNCSSLKSITIPNSVISIGMFAFHGCTRLTSVTIPNSVTSIGEGAFEYCTGLTSVTFPNSVTSTGALAFYRCTGLTSVTIPNSVTTIGAYAFEGCSGLTSVTIPNSVTTIDVSAFRSCTGLTSVTIPNFVTSIGQSAFSGCSNVTELFYNAENLKECGNSAFPISLPKVTFGDNVNFIPSRTFNPSRSLKEVHVSSIESWVKIHFEDKYDNPLYFAKKLYVNGELVEHLTIPEGVQRLYDNSFFCCEPLETVILPSSLDSIGTFCFYDCKNLKEIYCMAQEPPVADYYTFPSYRDCTLYVPIGTRSKYKDDRDCWGRFSNIIETDFAGIGNVGNDNPDAVEGIFDDSINSEIDFSAPLEFYTLSGARIANSTDHLAPGIYIVRQGNATKKIAIK